jgi:GNAT acetyltransferase-like protein
MAFEVVPYEPALRATWDEAVRGARARHFLFERAYMDYHADRFEDASLLVLDGQRPVAAVPASRAGDEVVSHGGLTFGGLLSGPELTTAQAVEALGAVLARLRADGARRFVVKPVPHIYHVVPTEEELFALTVHGARLTRRDVSAAIPRGAPVRYSSERRRAVKKGAANELDLRRSYAFDEFMALQREVLRARHGLEPVHTAAEIRLLADRFPDAIKLYAAHDAGGAIVAGVIVFETATVAHAQYIGANDRGRELRAGDALFDHLIREVFGDKRWFDFGISNERDGTLNAGLARNKEGFGARTVVYDRYELELA